MSHVVVVGSGASGVHFALTALERGHEVTMVDAGAERPAPVEPDANIEELKDRLEDPAAWFLGDDGRNVVYPATKASYYGFPPSKEYVFRTPPAFRARSERMVPVFSFAQGGLAEAWTAGAYAFAASDLTEFPFGYEDLAPFYTLVAERIGVGAEPDDLAAFIPFEAPYLPPLPFDPHSAHLVARYERRRAALQRELGFYLGRSRVATLSRTHRGRQGCGQLGRCFWGCPNEALYTPLYTLRELRAHPRFRYLPGLLATHLEQDAGARVSAVVARPLAGGDPVRVEGQVFALAAGALASSALVLATHHHQSGEVATLGGLMDNRQVHVPFLTPAMIGKPVRTASYQFHLLAFGLTNEDPAEYVHAQITTLKAAAVHPIVQGLPLDLAGSLAVFRALRTGLALANVNFHDRRRAESQLTILPRNEGPPELVLRYVDDPAEPALVARTLARVRRALGRLGCVVPPGMTRVLPKGASVHYSGTLPMTRDDQGRFSATPEGRLRGWQNLYVADGAGFPFLPAKNLTFTLMANASRIASRVG
jgi:choline dehydrogenase-like flavoprotein